MIAAASDNPRRWRTSCLRVGRCHAVASAPESSPSLRARRRAGERVLGWWAAGWVLAGVVWLLDARGSAPARWAAIVWGIVLAGLLLVWLTKLAAWARASPQDWRADLRLWLLSLAAIVGIAGAYGALLEIL